jgi:Myb-like DNA-binding domain
MNPHLYKRGPTKY